MITTLRLATGVRIFADPYMFMNYWFESDKKVCRVTARSMKNSEVDKLLRNALATTDQTQRTRDYQQAQKIVIDDAAYVYLFQKNYQLAMNKRGERLCVQSHAGTGLQYQYHE